VHIRVNVLFLMNDKKINPIIPAIVAVVAIILLVFLGLQLLGTSEDSMTDDSSESAMQENSNETVSVGGAAMFSDRTIVDNVVNAPNLSTLVSAVQAADLVETLQGDGPFTVFGPDNDAFEK